MRRRKYTKWSGDFPPHNSADWLAEGHVTLSAGAAGSVNVKPNWHAMRGKYRALPLGLGEAMIDAPVEVVRNSLCLGSVGSRVLGVTPREEEPLASSHPPGWPLWSAPDRGQPSGTGSPYRGGRQVLDQGQEPQPPRPRARQRILLMTSCMLSFTVLGLIHSEAAEPSAMRVAGGVRCSSGVSRPICIASFLVIL